MSSDIPIGEFREGDMGQSSIKIERMEEIFDRASGQIDTPHRHGYNTVVWIREGEGSHEKKIAVLTKTNHKKNLRSLNC